VRASNVLLRVERHEGQVQHDGEPVPVNNEEEGQESVDSGFGDDIGIEAVAEVDGVDVVAGKRGSVSLDFAFDVDQDGIQGKEAGETHHSRSLYIIVKNTWRKRLTALINTDNR
jgi:hypothetical protein